MKIDYAVMGTTQDWYMDFWPSVSRVWRDFFKITPVLGIIGDEETDFIEKNGTLIKYFKKTNKASEGYQAQFSRFLLCRDLKGTSIITDIDILPLSREYFIEKIKDISEDKFVLFTSDHKDSLDMSQYPMCYVAAKNTTYNEIINTGDSKNMDEFIQHIYKYQSFASWYGDQLFLFFCVNHFNDQDRIVKLKRFTEPDLRRIDRVCNMFGYNRDLVKQGHYIDAHLLRPYSQFKSYTDNLIELLLNENSNPA